MAKSAADIAELLSPSVGAEKARELVTDAIATLGLRAETVTVEDALAVLEHIAQQPGVVGITARFAKSRVHLNWSA